MAWKRSSTCSVFPTCRGRAAIAASGESGRAASRGRASGSEWQRGAAASVAGADARHTEPCATAAPPAIDRLSALQVRLHKNPLLLAGQLIASSLFQLHGQVCVCLQKTKWTFVTGFQRICLFPPKRLQFIRAYFLFTH